MPVYSKLTFWNLNLENILINDYQIVSNHSGYNGVVDGIAETYFHVRILIEALIFCWRFCFENVMETILSSKESERISLIRCYEQVQLSLEYFCFCFSSYICILQKVGVTIVFLINDQQFMETAP